MGDLSHDANAKVSLYAVLDQLHSARACPAMAYVWTLRGVQEVGPSGAELVTAHSLVSTRDAEVLAQLMRAVRFNQSVLYRRENASSGRALCVQQLQSAIVAMDIATVPGRLQAMKSMVRCVLVSWPVLIWSSATVAREAAERLPLPQPQQERRRHLHRLILVEAKQNVEPTVPVP